MNTSNHSSSGNISIHDLANLLIFEFNCGFVLPAKSNFAFASQIVYFFPASCTTFFSSFTLHYVNKEERKEGKIQPQLFFEHLAVLWVPWEMEKERERKRQEFDVQNLKLLLD